MNPFLSRLLIGALQMALAAAATELMRRGFLPQGAVNDQQLGEVAAGMVTALGALAWMARSLFHSQQKIVTLAAAAGTTEHACEKEIKDPNIATPSVMTPKSEIPQA